MDKDDVIAQKIMDIIAQEGAIPREKVALEVALADLEIQSVDMVMILQGIEEHFDLYIPMDESMHALKTVEDIVVQVHALIRKDQAHAS